jgi:hypothetical protein
VDGGKEDRYLVFRNAHVFHKSLDEEDAYLWDTGF